MKNLQCLRILSLINCGLSDENEEEIGEIFALEKLEYIDFKSNYLEKKSATVIGKKLKEVKNHLTYLEYYLIKT